MRFVRDALVTVVLLVAIAAVVAIVVVRRGGLAANEEPGRLERTIAGQLMRLSIPPAADAQQNPFANDPEAWKEAQQHYDDHCAVCHARDGRGDTEVGKNMYPRVPDLTSRDVQNRSDGALFHIIENGVRWTGMPAWKDEHSAEETWKLVAFLRKAPTLTDADLRRDESIGTTGENPGRPEARPHRHPR